MSSKNHLYASAPVVGILRGVTKGEVSIVEVLSRGKFGLGTFDGLDGELVFIDGECHQFTADGAHRVVSDGNTPYSAVFDMRGARRIEGITSSSSLSELESTLKSRAFTGGLNAIYGFVVKGSFSRVSVRVVGPARDLSHASSSQAEFDFTDIQGSLVGQFVPSLIAGGAFVPGFHVHFIGGSTSALKGGHVLGISGLSGATIEVVQLDGIQVDVPRSLALCSAELSSGDRDALEAAERAKK